MKYLFVLLVGVCAQAAEPKLRWDFNPANENVVSYRVHFRSAETNGVVSVGNTNVCPLPTMTAGSPMWFSVSCVNSAGLESLTSQEIAFIVPWIRYNAISGNLRYEFLRVTKTSNLSYALEFSEDLTVWTDQFPFIPDVVTLPGGVEMYRVDVPFAVAPHLFARVRVEIR